PGAGTERAPAGSGRLGAGHPSADGAYGNRAFARLTLRRARSCAYRSSYRRVARLRRDVGMKRSVVLLHGWGMRAAFWRGICAQLADCDVLTPDLPGYGAAPGPSPYALDAVVDVLAGAVPEEVDLVGWSLGGTIAMHWAATHPEQVRRLVLIAATPRFVGHAEWAHGVSPAVFRVFGAQLQRDPAALMQRFCVLQAEGEAQPEAVAARLYEQHA